MDPSLREFLEREGLGLHVERLTAAGAIDFDALSALSLVDLRGAVGIPSLKARKLVDLLNQGHLRSPRSRTAAEVFL